MITDALQVGHQGRQRMRDYCLAVAEKYTPEGVKVEYRRLLSGRAFTREGRMCVPRPVTRRSLYVYLHECAHFKLHSKRRKPCYVEEMEAEKWAAAVMRREGIEVHTRSIEGGKRYVRYKVRQTLKRGLQCPDAKVMRWCGMWR